MSTLATGAFAPSSLPPECTGVQAGISTDEQIRLVLETIQARGGQASMTEFYAAVEAMMAPHKLSTGGKAALRCTVGRTCVQRGLLTANTTARKAAQWAITTKGRALAPPEPPDSPQNDRKQVATPNMTALWLQEHLTAPRGQQTSDLYRMLQAALRRKLPVSGHADLIDDHLQTFLERLIRRDSLRKMLDAQQAIPYTKLVAYCVNSGRTDVRDMGTEPVCRVMYGARTERERRTSGENPTPCFEHEHPSVLDTDGNLCPQDDDTMINDTAPDFEVVWNRISQVINNRKPRAGDRYTGILAMKMKGYTLQEIARAEGVSRNRAASMLATARRCVRGCHDFVSAG